MSKLSINPIVRAVGVMGIVAGLVTGVTFAALNSQATLTGNTISAAPGLQLSVVEGVFKSSVGGFAFDNLIPGDPAGVAKTFKMRNATASSAMAVSMRIPTAVTFGAGTVDKTKVHVALSCDVPALSATSTLTALETAEVPVTGTLTAGATTNCTVTATMDADAITSGDAVTSSAFDLRFTGV